MQNENTDPAGREQKTTFLLDAPIELVWEVFTNPDHIRHWWGPTGFTNTIEKMEVKNGGEWIFVMQGPDGNQYPNRTMFREVIEYKRLMHEHIDPNFIAIIEFEKRENKTQIHWYKLYETKELFDLVEVQYKSSEGFKQTVEKLKSYLVQIKIADRNDSMPETSKQLRRTPLNTWKYVGWAFAGGIVGAIPATLLAWLTGIRVITPIGVVAGAVLFMMNRIYNDKLKI